MKKLSKGTIHGCLEHIFCDCHVQMDLCSGGRLLTGKHVIKPRWRPDMNKPPSNYVIQFPRCSRQDHQIDRIHPSIHPTSIVTIEAVYCAKKSQVLHPDANPRRNTRTRSRVESFLDTTTLPENTLFLFSNLASAAPRSPQPPTMPTAGLKTIISLSFVLAVGFLLVILSCALFKDYLPLLVVGTYILAPVPNWICGRISNPDDFVETSGNAVLDLGRFFTGFFVIMGIGTFSIRFLCAWARVASGACLRSSLTRSMLTIRFSLQPCPSFSPTPLSSKSRP